MVPVLITVQELDANYTWKASPSSINVLLAGSPDWLRSVRTGEIRAIVDLAELGPGVYTVEPLVSVPDNLSMDSIMPRTVEIKIEAKIVTETITSTATLSNTETPAIITVTPQR